tara:strand:- start:5652 stop:6725 length:1074 start_codon:yes stop_codon:yes gene_type:complete
MYYRIKIFVLLFILNFIGCENSIKSDKDIYIDPHIIFSSRRWWNYDIYITDIYNSSMSHITKNKHIDFNPSISPDSKKLAFVSDRDGNREIYIADLEWLDGYTRWVARGLSNITNSIENDWTPSFSPLENVIVFSTYFPANDNYDIFIMDLDSGSRINLTNTDSYEKFPQFSPDGSFIIYQGWYKGKMEIFFTNLLDKNRINLTRNPFSNDIISHGNCFSADGQKIVFTSERDGNRNIYMMNSDGSNQEKITSNESDDYEPIFSPDGLTIVFTSERDGNKEIYSYSIESKKISNLSRNSGDDWNARFYGDSDKLIFQSSRDGNWEIYRMGYDGSNQVNLTNHPSTDYSYVVLPLLNP